MAGTLEMPCKQLAGLFGGFFGGFSLGSLEVSLEAWISDTFLSNVDQVTDKPYNYIYWDP